MAIKQPIIQLSPNHNATKQEQRPHEDHAMPLSGTDLINDFELYFDGADMTNASLYVCVGADLTDADAQAVIATLRGDNLWSAEPAKIVPEAHKPMYAKEMKFIDYISGKYAGKTFHAAAYDHPKFACNPARWEQWKATIGSKFG